jgi:hypothetical protein
MRCVIMQGWLKCWDVCSAQERKNKYGYMHAFSDSQYVTVMDGDLPCIVSSLDTG